MQTVNVGGTRSLAIYTSQALGPKLLKVLPQPVIKECCTARNQSKVARRGISAARFLTLRPSLGPAATRTSSGNQPPCAECGVVCVSVNVIGSVSVWGCVCGCQCVWWVCKTCVGHSGTQTGHLIKEHKRSCSPSPEIAAPGLAKYCGRLPWQEHQPLPRGTGCL